MGFSVRNLKYMKKFYIEYKDDIVVQRYVAQLSWRHNLVLMSKISNNKVRLIYAEAVIKNGWSNETIGLLLCRNKDKLTVKWSLNSTNVPIGISTFELNGYVPNEILDMLPTEDDLNLYIDISEY